MSSSSTNNNNNNNNSDSIKIDWNELISLFEGHYKKCLNQNHNHDDDDDPYVLPTIQVDTNCCVVIIPMEIEDDDDDDIDHNNNNNDNIDMMIRKKQQRTKNKIRIEEPPSNYTYHITIIALIIEKCTGTLRNNNDEKSGYTIHLYSTSTTNRNTTTIESTFNHLLYWFNHSNSLYSNYDYYWNITIQAFAKQPRTTLPTIHDHILSNPLTVSNGNCNGSINSGNIRTLRICYFTINHTLLDWSTNQHSTTTTSIEKIELVQCTIDCDWNDLFVVNHNTNGTAGTAESITSQPPDTIVVPKQKQQQQRRALSISCSLPEFIKCIPYLHSYNTNYITDLSLILHFYIPDNQNWNDFCIALSQCCTTTLINLSIQYLDLSDNCWDILCTTLQNHMKNNGTSTIRSISLSYTDNFIDNHRRLSEEQRMKRTQSILSLVQSIPTIQNINFPTYQQDPIIMNQVNTILEQRRLETTTIIL